MLQIFKRAHLSVQIAKTEQLAILAQLSFHASDLILLVGNLDSYHNSFILTDWNPQLETHLRIRTRKTHFIQDVH